MDNTLLQCSHSQLPLTESKQLQQLPTFSDMNRNDNMNHTNQVIASICKSEDESINDFAVKQVSSKAHSSYRRLQEIVKINEKAKENLTQ